MIIVEEHITSKMTKDFNPLYLLTYAHANDIYHKSQKVRHNIRNF